MPKFSRTSRDKLMSCDVRLVKLFNAVIKDYDCTIVDGHRSRELQRKYFETGKSTTMNSKHCFYPSRAVDVAPYDKKRKLIPWNDLNQFYHFVGYVRGVAQAMQIPIRCGADWNGDFDLKDQNFNDLPHFEVVAV